MSLVIQVFRALYGTRRFVAVLTRTRNMAIYLPSYLFKIHFNGMIPATP